MNGRNKTKIALVKPSNEPLANWASWCDGLYGALDILGKEFNIRVFGYSNTPAVIKKDNIEIQLADNPSSLKYWLRAFNPKLIFGWGVSYDPWKEIKDFEGKKVLLYAGGPPDKDKADKNFDAVVVENESDKEHFDTEYVAFGTNTDYFKPMELEKYFPAIYPAAFAAYKRHDLWAKVVPPGSLAIGHIQTHEIECYETVVRGGHIALPQISMDTIPHFYNQSIATVLTPTRMGGCQRAALESMACNIPVLTTLDSKASEFDGVWGAPPIASELAQAYMVMVVGFTQNPVNLREKYIIGKYDQHTYADKLRKVVWDLI